MCAKLFIRRGDRPAILIADVDSIGTLVDHRLDGNGCTLREPQAMACSAEIRYVGIFVQRTADAMPHKILYRARDRSRPAPKNRRHRAGDERLPHHSKRQAGGSCYPRDGSRSDGRVWNFH